MPKQFVKHVKLVMNTEYPALEQVHWQRGPQWLVRRTTKKDGHWSGDLRCRRFDQWYDRRFGGGNLLCR